MTTRSMASKGRTLENKMWSRVFDDGLLLGSNPVYVAAKRRITLPRVGYFKPNQKHRTRAGVVGAIAVSVSILMVGATMMAVTGSFASGVPLLLILFGILAVKMVVMFSLAAYYLGVARFYGYAILGAVGMAGAEIAVATTDTGRWWDVIAMFGLPAIVMVPTGVVLLSRFVRAYPLPKERLDV